MKTGIIVANTGSPAAPTPDAVEAYLRAYLMDDRIRQLPRPLWRNLMHKHVLPKRKFTSAERYRSVWTPQGSPLEVNQQRLVDKVQAAYDQEEGAPQEATLDSACDRIPGNAGLQSQNDGDRALDCNARTGTDGGAGDALPTDAPRAVVVRSAMSYGSFSIEAALKDVRAAGCERIVLLPLYPQSAHSTTQAVIDAFFRARKRIGWNPPSCLIDNYHDNPLYIQTIADRVLASGFQPGGDARLMFSFHAIPLKDEKAGDTYRGQAERTAELVANALGMPASRITLAYQSVFGPKESAWVSPLAAHVLESWRNADFPVFFCCPGFAVDCLETLYDIPNIMVPALEGDASRPRACAADTGGDIQAACNTTGRFTWVPCLNASDAAARLVKDVLDVNMAASAFGD